ncbi:MAG: hypothetical protein H6779_01340 [Candidatus Nomurabacteria bacterium]|nr:MAG: hypothetical protein H6779_01340 [Candidatus Nomurabacteria bacterium]
MIELIRIWLTNLVVLDRSGNTSWNALYENLRTYKEITALKESPRWTDFCRTHITHCQSSIEEIVGKQNYFRRRYKHPTLSLLFNKDTDRVEIYESEIFVAELYMYLCDGYPHKIVLVKHSPSLSKLELNMFKFVRYSGGQFNGMKLGLMLET